MTTLHEIALLRLVALRIACPGSATATEAVRWLTALQAQDYNGALTSVALRTASGNHQGVEAALDAGEIVKSWPLRGTLHLVVAEDLPWMLNLGAPRVVASAAGRRAQLGLDMSLLEHARQLAVQALAGGHLLRREDLLAVWNEGGLVTAGQRGYHMLWHLAQTGTLCFGPVRDGEQRVVLVDEWIPHPRCPEREEALGELAWRYFRSHGPATVKDFTRWTNLVAADVRAFPAATACSGLRSSATARSWEPGSTPVAVPSGPWPRPRSGPSPMRSPRRLRRCTPRCRRPGGTRPAHRGPATGARCAAARVPRARTR